VLAPQCAGHLRALSLDGVERGLRDSGINLPAFSIRRSSSACASSVLELSSADYEVAPGGPVVADMTHQQLSAGGATNPRVAHRAGHLIVSFAILKASVLSITEE
jgi:hypothetical protein